MLINIRLKLFLIFTLMLGSLTSCAPPSSISEPISDFLSDPIKLPCPDYRILSDASKFVKFKSGGGRGLIDIEFQTTITNMRLICKSKVDKETRTGAMDIDIMLDFAAERGPIIQSGDSNFSYFISITDRNKNILYREQFKIDFNFKKNASRLLIISKPITIELPISRHAQSDDFIIFSGFLVSREQLLRNRNRRM